jgi:hypothetical protein
VSVPSFRVPGLASKQIKSLTRLRERHILECPIDSGNGQPDALALTPTRSPPASYSTDFTEFRLLFLQLSSVLPLASGREKERERKTVLLQCQRPRPRPHLSSPICTILGFSTYRLLVQAIIPTLSRPPLVYRAKTKHTRHNKWQRQTMMSFFLRVVRALVLL